MYCGAWSYASLSIVNTVLLLLCQWRAEKKKKKKIGFRERKKKNTHTQNFFVAVERFQGSSSPHLANVCCRMCALSVPPSYPLVGSLQSTHDDGSSRVARARALFIRCVACGYESFFGTRKKKKRLFSNLMMGQIWSNVSLRLLRPVCVCAKGEGINIIACSTGGEGLFMDQEREGTEERERASERVCVCVCVQC